MWNLQRGAPSAPLRLVSRPSAIPRRVRDSRTWRMSVDSRWRRNRFTDCAGETPGARASAGRSMGAVPCRPIQSRARGSAAGACSSCGEGVFFQRGAPEGYGQRRARFARGVRRTEAEFDHRAEAVGAWLHCDGCVAARCQFGRPESGYERAPWVMCAAICGEAEKLPPCRPKQSHGAGWQVDARVVDGEVATLPTNTRGAKAVGSLCLWVCF